MKRCPVCGHDNALDASACASCGVPLMTGGSVKSTMLGMPIPKGLPTGASEAEPPAATEAPPVEAPPVAAPRASKSTVFGAPSPFGLEIQDTAPAEAAGPTAPPDPAPAVGTPVPREAVARKQTMFGIPSPVMAQQPEAPKAAPPGAVAPEAAPPEAEAPEASAQPAVEPADSRKQTMFGAPSPFASGEAGEEATDPEGPETSDEGPDEGMDSQQKSARASTMFGAPSPFASGQQDTAPVETVPSEAPEASLQAEEPARKSSAVAPAAPAGRAEENDTVTTLEEAPPDPEPSSAATLTPPQNEEPARAKAGAASPAGRPSDDRSEDYAAARFAAAVAEEEQAQSRRGISRALVALLIVLVIAAAAGWVFWQSRQAFAAGLSAIDTVAEGGNYRVKLSVSASSEVSVESTWVEAEPAGDRFNRPVKVDSPTVADRLTVKHDVEIVQPETDLKLGPNPLKLVITPREAGLFDKPVMAQVNIMIYFRVHHPQGGGKGPRSAILEVAPGFIPVVKEGQARKVGDQRYLVPLNPEAVKARAEQASGDVVSVPIEFDLQGESETVRGLTAVVDVPLPGTPLVLTAPARHWARASEQVQVEGRTSPGATVKVGEQEVTADDQGVFQLDVPIKETGEVALAVEARAPASSSGKAMVRVERLTDEEAAKKVATLKESADAFLKGAKRTPKYNKLAGKAREMDGRRIAVVGTVVSVRRGDGSNLDVVQITTCKGGNRCPFWVETDQPILVGAGQKVRVAGRVAGLHTWTTREGARVTAPRITAVAVVP